MSSVPNQIRILTLDDHPLLREGIAALVNAESDMKLVAEACKTRDPVRRERASCFSTMSSLEAPIAVQQFLQAASRTP
jgi:DNA-binding NarL/FixJ family response regulator